MYDAGADFVSSMYAFFKPNLGKQHHLFSAVRSPASLVLNPV